MANPNRPDQPKQPQSTGSGSPRPGQQGQQSGQGNYTFRCADVGFSECKWETRGNSQDEVLRNAEQHGREKHNLTNIDEEPRNKVRSNIRQAA